MTFYHTSPALTILGDRLLSRVWDTFPDLERDQLSLTWLVYPGLAKASTPWTDDRPDLLRGQLPWGYTYQGNRSFYPASVVKLFYLIMVYEALETGRLQHFAELERATRDMIVDSSNDATGFVMDALTDTTSGLDLPPLAFERWQYQRNRINRYFQSLGWPELSHANLNQKTWCDGAYGRERSFLGQEGANRNRLNTLGTARVFHGLITQDLLSSQACQAMMKILKRSLKPADLKADPENQVTGFLGGGLPQSAKLWSKAGLMSRVRHDAAYLELAPLPPSLLVVFTEGSLQSRNEQLLPFIAQETIAALSYSTFPNTDS